MAGMGRSEGSREGRESDGQGRIVCCRGLFVPTHKFCDEALFARSRGNGLGVREGRFERGGGLRAKFRTIYYEQPLLERASRARAFAHEGRREGEETGGGDEGDEGVNGGVLGGVVGGQRTVG